MMSHGPPFMGIVMFKPVFVREYVFADAPQEVVRK
jgi:hypothetical protein